MSSLSKLQTMERRKYLRRKSDGALLSKMPLTVCGFCASATSIDLLQLLQSRFLFLELDTVFSRSPFFPFHLSRYSLKPFYENFMDIYVNFDDDELPPLIDPETENVANDNNVPTLIHSGRNIAMPSECTTNPLQRALADSIIRMVSLDELRILFACGAKVSD